jgi:hypothetical protein
VFSDENNKSNQFELVVENDDEKYVVTIYSDCQLVRIPPFKEIPPNLHRIVAYPRSRDPRSANKTDQLACK